MLLLIIILTISISWYAFQNEGRKHSFMLKPYLVVHRQQWHRLISHAFIHADTTHLLFNMFVLWQFGSSVENQLQTGSFSPLIEIPGEYTFLMLYAGGLFTATVPALIKHRTNPGYASLGASGAVSAVMMAYILLFPTAKLLLFFVIPMPAFVAGILFFSYESYMNKNGRTNIAHDAHLWGALFGVMFTLAADNQTVNRLYDSIHLLF